jgi:phage terminase large subunit-like protein
MADRIVAEENNGGKLVEQNLRTLWQNVPYRGVRASVGKRARAEPVAAIYEQGRVHHVGSFPRLEDQLTTWEPLGRQRSPDRLDALVWAITDLSGGGPPRRDATNLPSR